MLNFLKLRASIGQLGNERIGSEFPYQASMEFSNGYIANKNTGIADPTQIAFQSTYAFENITWETTTTYGIGIDANFSITVCVLMAIGIIRKRKICCWL